MELRSPGVRRVRARALRAGRRGLLALAAGGALCGSGCDGPRVLVVGIDGATWSVMDPLIDAGYLPNMAGVVADGATYALDCVPSAPTSACFCPPVWTSIATGAVAGDHGIFAVDTPSGARGVKALWNVLAEHGGESTLLSYRGTWPPEPGIGVVLTEPGTIAAGRALFDAIDTSTHPGLSQPDTLAQPLDLLEQLDVLPSPTPPEERLPAWQPFAQDRVTMEVLLRIVLRDRGPVTSPRPPQLTMVLLHSPDRSEHMAWSAIQAAMWAPIDVDALLFEASKWGGPVFNAPPYPWSSVPAQYQEIDAWLGELLSATAYDYVVLVSDHGMTRGAHGSSIPGAHGLGDPEAHVGILVLHGAGIVAGRPRGAATVLDVAPTVAYMLGLPVAQDLPGAVLEAAFTAAHREALPVAHVPSWE